VALDTFYQTAAQICFTLLGLWWLVLQTKYAEWIGDRSRRRMATNVSLYFLLPGAMSLMALTSHARLLWATAFVVASLFGGVETGYNMFARTRDGERPRSWQAYALGGLGMGLYLLILLVALFPGIPTGLGVVPLTVESVLLTLLVVLGAGLAWRYFAEPRASAK
jgi:hypothetical protein